MLNKSEVQALIDRYLTGTLDQEGRAALRDIINEPAYEEMIGELMDRHLADRLAEEHAFPAAHGRARKAVLQQIHRAPGRPVLIRRWRWAAAVMLLLGAGLAAVLFRTGSKEANPTVTAAKAEVLPGRNGAILTLANGSRMVLDSMGNGVIASQNGASVILKNGSLQYAPAQNKGNDIAYNVLATPRGRQFRLTLPDGTVVWLNAASSIRYPVAFTGKFREVEIRGEAYFEVTGDAAAPFRVTIGDKAVVEVLGTAFNLSAYADEPQIRATLLQGKIKVSSKDAVLLQPGQQAVLGNDPGKEEVTLVKDADTEAAVAWKEGYFRFKGADIKTVMQQLARWYNIDVSYEGHVTGRKFSGELSRSSSLPEVLKGLTVNGINYRRSGDSIIIIP